MLLPKQIKTSKDDIFIYDSVFDFRPASALINALVCLCKKDNEFKAYYWLDIFDSTTTREMRMYLTDNLDYLSTIKNAGWITVIENGKIIELTEETINLLSNNFQIKD